MYYLHVVKQHVITVFDSFFSLRYWLMFLLPADPDGPEHLQPRRQLHHQQQHPEQVQVGAGVRAPVKDEGMGLVVLVMLWLLLLQLL